MNMYFQDESLIMISALQHYLFCPRQCALIHVEGVWSENYLTATGRVMHERVDRKGAETRRDVHLAASLRLVSHRLGVTGVAVSLVNLRQVTAKDFKTTERGAVEMSESARKTILMAWQKKKQEQIVHPFLNEKTSIGILPHLQALLLARFLRGEFSWLSPSYPINKFYNHTPKLKSRL